MIECVVARYNEDISWLDKLLPYCKIYNKGKPLDISQEIPLENIGREADTYLRYIIEYYDNLPDYVFFTQGNPTDHIKSVEEVYVIFKGLLNDVIRCDYYPFSWYNGFQYWEIVDFKDLHHHNLPLMEAWDKFFDNHEQGKCIMCNYNAIFIASRDRIRHHPKQFYEMLLEYNNENDGNAYVLERLWTTIMDGKTKSLQRA